MNILRKTFFIKVFMSSITILSVVRGGAYASTYLESNKNYYTDPGISRGFLDSPISKEILGEQNWNMFQVAVSKNLISYSPGMTFNQYYLANNISPEDNFIVYPGLTNQIVRLKSGAYLNANPNPKGAKDDSGNAVDYITYVGPTDDRGAYWGDKELEDPVLFSRLTVGELSPASEGTLGIFSSGTYLFPTQIGYGENATVNDYMLTPENDFIIPTRFNTIRNDVYLTMRSRAYFGAGLQGAQASLTATSNGKAVVGSSENSKFYIDTNSNVYLTKQGFDQLGNFGKFMAPSVYTSASDDLKKVGIDKFSAMMNQGLSSIQSNSGAKTIVSGNGGQIQLSGFDRETNLDGAFSSSLSDRENDALKNTDVNFYMYTNGNTETNVTTPLAPNGYHLYSPNVSQFKIQTTRPYFSWTGDLSNDIKTSEANANFDDLLGINSVKVTDNGVGSDGKPISVDLNRVRIRISEDEGSTYSSNSYTLDDLKTLLSSGNITVPKIVIAYTYSATDSKTDNIGKLPNEIDDNTGAYAVPFTRTLTNDIPDKKSSITVKYVDTSGNTISDDVVKTGNAGDSYTTEQKVITGYTFKEVQGSASGQFTNQEQTVTYVYTKDPVVGGNVVAKYVDTSGDTISDNVVKSGNVGADYNTEQKVIPGYTFKEVQGSASGQFTSQEQTVTYVYTKDSVVGGSVIVKYVDTAGNTISDNIIKTGNIGEDYTTEQKAIPGYTFKEVQGSPSGQFTDQEQTVTYVYTKDTVIGGNVTANYVDIAGNTISDKVIKTGNIGEDYTTEQKAIPGYTFKEVQGSASGQFTNQEQTVTYVYMKDSVVGGNIIAKYVDTAGNIISDNVVKNGNIGEDYTTEQKVIPGYTFKEVHGSPSGQFTNQEQTVTYIYTKNTMPPVKPTSPSSNQPNVKKPTQPVPSNTNISVHNNVSAIGNTSNTNGKDLPRTGEKNSSWGAIIGGLVALTAIALHFLKKKRSHNN